jgi:hypothetical protein
MNAAGDTLGVTAEPAAATSEPAAAAANGLAVDTAAAAEPGAKKVKRNVALHVGYVGTAYTGTASSTAATAVVEWTTAKPGASCATCSIRAWQRHQNQETIARTIT